MRRLVPAIALAALLAPAVASADQTYTPADYVAGPKRQGDQWNTIQADPATGRMTVLRHNPVPGSFGCGGAGPYATFQVTRALAGVTAVEARVNDALVDAYSWVTVSLLEGTTYIATEKQIGPILGSAIVRLALADRGLPPASGTLTVRFGIEVASACPNVDGGIATFSSVTARTA